MKFHPHLVFFKDFCYKNSAKLTVDIFLILGALMTFAVMGLINKNFYLSILNSIFMDGFECVTTFRAKTKNIEQYFTFRTPPFFISKLLQN
jgi:hypothetical protein